MPGIGAVTVISVYGIQRKLRNGVAYATTTVQRTLRLLNQLALPSARAADFEPARRKNGACFDYAPPSTPMMNQIVRPRTPQLTAATHSGVSRQGDV